MLSSLTDVLLLAVCLAPRSHSPSRRWACVDDPMWIVESARAAGQAGVHVGAGCAMARDGRLVVGDEHAGVSTHVLLTAQEMLHADLRNASSRSAGVSHDFLASINRRYWRRWWYESVAMHELGDVDRSGDDVYRLDEPSGCVSLAMWMPWRVLHVRFELWMLSRPAHSCLDCCSCCCSLGGVPTALPCPLPHALALSPCPLLPIRPLTTTKTTVPSSSNGSSIHTTTRLPYLLL